MKNVNQSSHKPDECVYKEITERQAINFLLMAFEGSENRGSDLNIFNNILYGEHYLQNWRNYTGCYCLQNFLVKDIGLEAQGKPGEIDILLIPFDTEKVFYEKASVFEIKVTKPNFQNINKGPNSDGYSQTLGLIKLGFPYVGIIHIVLSTPIPHNNRPDIKFMKTAMSDEPRKEENATADMEDFELMKWDWLPFYAERNQMKRLLSYDIPKYVGLKALSLHLYADDTFALGYSQDFKDFETGFKSPHRKKKTVEIVKAHHTIFYKNYKKINFNLSV